MERRSFLKASLAGGALAGGWGYYWYRQPGENEFIAQTTDVQMLGEDYPYTSVWAFNDQIPGPLIRRKQGETLAIRFTNRLPQPSTIHWHGIRLPNAMDGVPGITQAAVRSGEHFDYQFALPDAGTYWYHPHVATYEQIGRGLYGAIIVEEKERVDVDEDILMVVSDIFLDKQGQIKDGFQSLHDAAHAGRLGNVILVNGQKARPKTMLRPGSRVRLRLINASSARIYRLKFHRVAPLIVAIDGHPCPVMAYKDTLYFSPGNRYDFIIDVPREEQTLMMLEDEFFPAMRNTLALFGTSSESPLPARAPFQGLPPNAMMIEDHRNAEKITLTIEGGALSNKASRESIWLMNGKGNAHSHLDAHGNAPEPVFTVDLGCTVHCMIDNQTAWFHPMHFHGVVLRERQKDGRWGPAKDSTLVWPFEKQEIMFVAEAPGDWMIHCHVSEHHHSGLMGTFRVSNLCRTTNPNKTSPSKAPATKI